MTQQFKEAARAGAKIVIVSVSHRSDDAIRANPDFRGRVVSIDIHEDKKNKISIKFTIPNILDGIIFPETGITKIFNHRFKLCDYPINSKINFHVFIDSIFLRPTAGCDSLNAESSGQFNVLADAFSSLLAQIAATSDGRLRAMS